MFALEVYNFRIPVGISAPFEETFLAPGFWFFFTLVPRDIFTGKLYAEKKHRRSISGVHALP